MVETGNQRVVEEEPKRTCVFCVVLENAVNIMLECSEAAC
jgi:hypothetical protein